MIVHFKYDKGGIVNLSLTSLEPNTEHVYSDGSATPFIHLSHMKEKTSSWKIKPPLYCLVGNYLIISLRFYFIISGIVFVFVWFLGNVLFSDYTVQYCVSSCVFKPSFGIFRLLVYGSTIVLHTTRYYHIPIGTRNVSKIQAGVHVATNFFRGGRGKLIDWSLVQTLTLF